MQSQQPGESTPTRVSFEIALPHPLKEIPLAKPNYSFEKRQRELAKKKKQQAKLEQKRQQRQPDKTAGNDNGTPAEAPPVESGS
jgi:hypothetical protein